MQLTDFLKENYNFSMISELEQFSKAESLSKVYRLKTNIGDLVLKQSDWYENQELDAVQILEKIYGLSEALRELGAPLPKTIANKKNNFVSLYDSDKFIVSEYAEGQKFSLSDEEFVSLGKALAQFHKTGIKYLKKYPQEYDEIIKSIPVEKPFEESRDLYHKKLRSDILSEHKCSHPEVCKTVRDNIEFIDELIKSIDDSKISDDSLTKGILHNDLNRKNIIFSSTGEILAFLDIDQLGVGPLIWDVSNTLNSFLWEFRKKNILPDFNKRAKLYLEAYNKILPLPPEEYKLLLAAAQRIDIMRILRSLRRHHYENNRSRELLPKIKDRIIPRLKLALEVFPSLNLQTS